MTKKNVSRTPFSSTVQRLGKEGKGRERGGKEGEKITLHLKGPLLLTTQLSDFPNEL